MQYTVAFANCRKSSFKMASHQSILLSVYDDELRCSICMEMYGSDDRKPRVLGCGHTFCHGCLVNTLERNECPTCRSYMHYLDINDIPINFGLKKLAEDAKHREYVNNEDTCPIHNIPNNCECNDCELMICGICGTLDHKQCEVVFVNKTFKQKKKDFLDAISDTQKILNDKVADLETEASQILLTSAELDDEIVALEETLKKRRDKALTISHRSKNLHNEISQTKDVNVKMNICIDETTLCSEMKSFREHKKNAIATIISAGIEVPNEVKREMESFVPVIKEHKELIKFNPDIPPRGKVVLNVRNWMKKHQKPLGMVKDSPETLIIADFYRGADGRYRISAFQKADAHFPLDDVVKPIKFEDFLAMNKCRQVLPKTAFFTVCDEHSFLGEVIVQVDTLSPRATNFLMFASGIANTKYTFKSTIMSGGRYFVSGGFRLDESNQMQLCNSPVYDISCVEDEGWNPQYRGFIDNNEDVDKIKGIKSPFRIYKVNAPWRKTNSKFGIVRCGLDVLDNLNSRNCAHIEHCGFIL